MAAAALNFTTPHRKLTWLITGCSSGFGLSLTRTVQAAGHTVIATSRTPSRTPELVAEVESRGGKWLKLDVDDPESERFVEGLENGGDGIDVLVNNAGYGILSLMETFAEDDMRAMMESMYFGPLRLIRAVLPHMRARRFGVVVNMSSGASLEANPTMGAYGASKAALDGATKTLAKEIALFNIRTLTVALGTFNTNMPTAITLGKTPMPEAYKGTTADQMVQAFSSGKYPVKGDKDKAMRAVFEVVVGEGAGKGREAENFLPLGSDLLARVVHVRDRLSHSLEVFGDVAKGVTVDE